MTLSSAPLSRRLRAVSWQRLYAAGVFLLFCFALLRLLAPQRTDDLFETYGRFLLAALFGAFLCREGFPREWLLRLHLGYLAWLLLTRWLNGDFYLFVDRELVRTEVLSFVMLSVGFVLGGEGRRRFLNVLSLVYAGFFVLFSALGLFVAVTGTYIHLPPENVWITIRAVGNPVPLLNLLSSFRLTSAARLYLSWGLLGYQFFRARRLLPRLLLALCMLILHLAIALCYSHTIWITLALSLAMLAVLLGHRYLRLQNRALRIALLALCFVAVFLAGYKSFGLSLRLRDLLRAELAPRFEQAYTASSHPFNPEYFGIAGPDPELTVDPAPHTSMEDVLENGDVYLETPRSVNTALTLSWRTLIWESVFYRAGREPAFLLRGQLSKEMMEPTNRYLEGVYRIPRQPNMHNCLFQVVLLTGLPGLLLVLGWFLLSIRRMLSVFFSGAEQVPLPIAFLTIPLTGMFLFSLMEYELFPAWDSSTRAFLLLLGIFTGLYHEYFPKQKAPAEAEA